MIENREKERKSQPDTTRVGEEYHSDMRNKDKEGAKTTKLDTPPHPSDKQWKSLQNESRDKRW